MANRPRACPVGPASELVVWSRDRRWCTSLCTYVVGPCTIVYVCSAPRAAVRYVLPRHQRGVGPSSTAAGDLPAGKTKHQPRSVIKLPACRPIVAYHSTPTDQFNSYACSLRKKIVNKIYIIYHIKYTNEKFFSQRIRWYSFFM
jgi:hypothetical protein